MAGERVPPAVIAVPFVADIAILAEAPGFAIGAHFFFSFVWYYHGSRLQLSRGRFSRPAFDAIQLVDRDHHLLSLPDVLSVFGTPRLALELMANEVSAFATILVLYFGIRFDLDVIHSSPLPLGTTYL